MQLLLFGLGTLLYGVDLIWVGEEDSNHGQFSLLAIAVVMIMIAAFALYAMVFVLHSSPRE